jgi:hypothetical protein
LEATITLEGGRKAGFWSRELGYGHAAVAVAGAVAAGWLLQWTRGGAPITPPAWPANIVFLGLLAGWIGLLSAMRNRLTAWLGGVPFALVTMAAVGLLATVGGVIPQTPDAPDWARAAGLHHVFSGAPFVVAMLLLLTNLGLATLRRGRELGLRGWLFSLNHAGLWIVLACGMFGAGDVIRARLMLVEGAADARIVDGQGRQGYLPFGLFLQRFYVEQYPGENESPGPARSFTAEVTVLHRDATVEDKIIRVNHPLRRAGWTLYLINYELSPDGQTDRCVVEAVRDPWLPGVYAGIFLLLAGAVAMLFRSPFGNNWCLPRAPIHFEGRAS